MPATITRPALTLDSAQLERLLTSMHEAVNDDAIAATVQHRLRYLQRNGFPNDRAGRGKRATYDLADIVRVLQQAPWTGEFDPLEGFVLHEAASGTAAAA